VAVAVAATLGVDHLKGDAVTDSGVGCVASGPADRVLVDVVAVDVDVRKRFRQLDGRPTHAAADVGHPCRVLGVLQAGVHVRDGGQPRRRQLVHERRPVQRGLGLDGLDAIPRVGHSGAGAEGLDQVGQDLADS